MSKTELIFCGNFIISEGISYQKNNIDSCVFDMFKSSDFNVVILEYPVTDATRSINN